MNNLKLIFLLITLGSESECGLLRKPKVYNAVITTDDNLTPSRSYPFIQPIIHETPIAYPFSSIHSYQTIGSYDYSPYHSGYAPQDVQSRNKDQKQHEYQPVAEEAHRSQESSINDNSNNENKKTKTTNKNDDNINTVVPVDEASKDLKEVEKTKRPPITLNEFGLPPSLIPLQAINTQYHSQPYPYNLQPFQQTSYPLIYDSFGNYRPQLLPPYAYYPTSGGFNYPQEIPNHSSNNQQPTKDILKVNNQNNKEKNDYEKIDEGWQKPTQLDVKNYSNKNTDIPDVPAPPLPISTRNNNESS